MAGISVISRFLDAYGLHAPCQFPDLELGPVFIGFIQLRLQKGAAKWRSCGALALNLGERALNMLVKLALMEGKNA